MFDEIGNQMRITARDPTPSRPLTVSNSIHGEPQSDFFYPDSVPCCRREIVPWKRTQPASVLESPQDNNRAPIHREEAIELRTSNLNEPLKERKNSLDGNGTDGIMLCVSNWEKSKNLFIGGIGILLPGWLLIIYRLRERLANAILLCSHQFNFG